MRLIPGGPADLTPNFRWAIELRLRLVREFATGTPASGNGAPGMEEAKEDIHRAVERRDREAEERAIEDRMRAELRDWWRKFREKGLLSTLYGRVALREAGCRPCDRCRLPSPKEGRRVAKALLAGVELDPGRFDPEWELGAVSNALAALFLPPFGVQSSNLLGTYIDRSEVSRVYFDAVKRIAEALRQRGKALGGSLLRWMQDVADQVRQRPARPSLPPHRTTTLDFLPRDLAVQFAIAILQELGIKPRGNPSGCRIVAEAISLSEEMVVNIWDERVWEVSNWLLMTKYSQSLAIRTGLDQFHRRS